MAASIVATVINYSISIGLGIAGTVESQINRDGTQVLAGYRSAWYVALGMSGAGLLLAISFYFVSRSDRKESEKVIEASTI